MLACRHASHDGMPVMPAPARHPVWSACCVRTNDGMQHTSGRAARTLAKHRIFKKAGRLNAKGMQARKRRASKQAIKQTSKASKQASKQASKGHARKGQACMPSWPAECIRLTKAPLRAKGSTNA
eukprot:UN3331